MLLGLRSLYERELFVTGTVNVSTVPVVSINALLIFSGPVALTATHPTMVGVALLKFVGGVGITMPHATVLAAGTVVNPITGTVAITATHSTMIASGTGGQDRRALVKVKSTLKKVMPLTDYRKTFPRARVAARPAPPVLSVTGQVKNPATLYRRPFVMDWPAHVPPIAGTADIVAAVTPPPAPVATPEDIAEALVLPEAWYVPLPSMFAAVSLVSKPGHFSLAGSVIVVVSGTLGLVITPSMLAHGTVDATDEEMEILMLLLKELL